MQHLMGYLASGNVASTSNGNFSFGTLALVIVAVVGLLSSFAKNAAKRKAQRKKRGTGPAAQLARGRGSAPTAAAQQPVQNVTLLNGIPIASYTNTAGQSGGFANERMRAEAELKRQLDALDTARRAGLVNAEQYATQREAIFRRF